MVGRNCIPCDGGPAAAKVLVVTEEVCQAGGVRQGEAAIQQDVGDGDLALELFQAPDGSAAGRLGALTDLVIGLQQGIEQQGEAGQGYDEAGYHDPDQGAFGQERGQAI